jgi:hypothetical protein
VQAKAVNVVKWIKTELRAGWIPAPQQTVAARKPRQGVRPVAVWAIPDRIIYRALVNTLLVHEPKLDRSSTAYLSFVRAPHTYSESVSTQNQQQREQADFFRLYDSPFSHVVKSDISAFYQYIDHSILARELMLKGQDYDLVDSLIQLLREAQGRTYGLPSCSTLPTVSPKSTLIGSNARSCGSDYASGATTTTFASAVGITQRR